MLTDHLLALNDNYNEAIEHPFLRAIGNGTASVESLSLWLSQDRIYAAHAYPRFIAHLITHIPFSSSDAIASPREESNQYILGVLSFCIQNVVREAQFFLQTAKKNSLDLDCWIERKETKEYVETMLRIASEGTLGEGLVFLWAMEKMYLDAWTFVGRIAQENSHANTNVQLLAREFVKNWTNTDFQKFVRELAHIVDGLDIAPDTEPWRRAEAVWNTVVSLETGFWPRIGEDISESSKKEAAQ
ncbi:heme oxygenase-like protein [Schizopora paradoxa]|uniref:Heme oxygenase-like protein n=1 Tax=Schizopora paradoxa TaxID=27342 RepID=A0A0H2S5X9_9AGAM|nr:heme oxygenase-like protein [Schizopora paradoxa]